MHLECEPQFTTEVSIPLISMHLMCNVRLWSWTWLEVVLRGVMQNVLLHGFKSKAGPWNCPLRSRNQPTSLDMQRSIQNYARTWQRQRSQPKSRKDHARSFLVWEYSA